MTKYTYQQTNLHSTLVTFKSVGKISDRRNAIIYIPLWLHLNTDVKKKERCSEKIYIPLWLHLNQDTGMVRVAYADIYIPLWLHLNR